MDRWRSYFRTSGTDIWTLIEQAIKVAATDHSYEFRTRRSEIAEILFSRSLLHPPSSSSQGSCAKESMMMDTTSIAPTRMDTNASRKNDERALGLKHNKMEKVAGDNVSTASISMETDVTVETRHKGEGRRHEEKSSELRLVCSGAIPCQELLRIKEILQDRDQSENTILRCLEKLETMHLSLEILKTTEIGKQVNYLRKHESNQVRLTVKRLVRSWKGMVDVWVDGASQSSDAAISGANDGKRDETNYTFDQCRSDVDNTLAPTQIDGKTYSPLDSSITCQSTSIEMPEQLFGFLKDVFPESGAVREDPDASGPILGTKLSVQSDPKKGKSSCALVLKVPKKKEIDRKLHLPSTERKSELMNQCNNSSVLVGSKSSIGRSGSQDEVDQKRNSMHFEQSMKLSKKVQAEKEDYNKRKPYNECKPAENAKKQCHEQLSVDMPEFSKDPTVTRRKMSSCAPNKYVGGYG